MNGKSGMHVPELLAPAGSEKALEAAVAAGADAVYLSGKRYGARKYADNFTDEELVRAVSYAHRHGVKVYVTVNTLLNDHELAEALGYMLELYALGVDAVLVQDIGLAALCRGTVPDLPLHASTQCTIFSVEGVRWAGSAGFERVVLARETPLHELDRIVAIEPEMRPGIEIFVHGALCYSYSGQCLLSSVIGGRSGNRGMCAQPCRKAYRLVFSGKGQNGKTQVLEKVDSGDRYLLSPRDLMLYPFLAEVLKRPVASLKIEGRMRSREYVGIVVSAYRKALQALEEGKPAPDNGDVADMSIMFSRGFTGGYLMGDRGPALMGRDRPDNRGLFLGRVVSCDPGSRSFTVRAETGYVPGKGDGLAFVDPQSGEISGLLLSVDCIPGKEGLIIPQRIVCREGSEVYVTGSARLAKKVARTIKASEYAHNYPIPIDISLVFTEGEAPVLHGRIGHAGRAVEIEHTASFIPERARTTPLSAAQIEEQMRKAGDSGFGVQKFEISYPGGLFIPIGELNRFRREFFEKALEVFLQSWRPDVKKVGEARRRYEELRRELEKVRGRPGKPPLSSPPGISVYADSPDSARAACEGGCSVVYYEPAGDGPTGYEKEVAEIFSLCREHGVLPVWKWPPVPRREFLVRAFGLISGLSGSGLGGIMVENLGLAEAVLERDPGIRLFGGQGLNVFNHRTVMALSPPFSRLTLSPELSGTQIRSLIMSLPPGHRELEVIVQGNLLAMVSEDPLLETLLPGDGMQVGGDSFFGLMDGTGRVFPVDTDSVGRTRIRNSAETCLVDHIPSLISAGTGSFAVDARGRSAAYAREMTEIYRDAIDLACGRTGGRTEDEFDSLKTRARGISRGGITAAYYTKGLSK